ncbi:MAG: Rpn family recombination-promoting nuclease/putative transposase [Lachnospiraceae bacterium]|nr:Rpn family recombination-promoting nuclease/putative transposase [Lachnospiraceae bacterium]
MEYTEQTQTAKNLDITEDMASYDKNAKLLISDPHLLAYILKHTVSELKDLDESEIIRRIVDQHITKIPVEPGETNEIFRSLSTESSAKDEGTVYFDILCTVVHLDDKDIETYLFVDFEIQRSAKGSDILPRAVFYCGRMISIQYGKEVTSDNYRGLRKVYTIWACVNCAKKDENTISRYYMTKEDVYGEFTDKQDCNMIEIVMIRLPEKVLPIEETHPLIRMVGTLLSDTMKASEKKKILEMEYNIKMTQESERRLTDMCNLSEGILEKGYRKSIGVLVRTCKKYGGTYEDAVRDLKKEYNMSQQEAEEAAKFNWDQLAN